MRSSFFGAALLAALVSAPLAAQTLTCVTSGVVQRIPGTPFIAGCPTVPEVYYFSITGTISQAPPSSQEIRLLVRPTLYGGGTIPGCEWVTQCQRAFVLPDNSFVVIGQFGTAGQPRSWYSGQTADIQFVLVDRATGIRTCVANPAAVSLAQSNVNRIVLDPSLPTLHDYEASCNNATMDVTGSPGLQQNLSFQLPQAGTIAFGVPDTFGFPIVGCTLYLSISVPPVLVATDPSGALALAMPNDPTLVGIDLGTQGVFLNGGNADFTQPTALSIR